MALTGVGVNMQHIIVGEGILVGPGITIGNNPINPPQNYFITEDGLFYLVDESGFYKFIEEN